MSLATKLVALRKRKGLTQMDLAEQLNVSRQAISRWEVGAAVPTIDNLRILSDIYETSVDYLLDDDAANIDKSTDTLVSGNDEQSSGRKTLNHWKIYSVIALVLVLLAVIFSVAIVPNQESKNITPIENMAVEEDNDSSPVTFPVE